MILRGWRLVFRRGVWRLCTYPRDGIPPSGRCSFSFPLSASKFDARYHATACMTPIRENTLLVVCAHRFSSPHPDTHSRKYVCLCLDFLSPHAADRDLLGSRSSGSYFYIFAVMEYCARAVRTLHIPPGKRVRKSRVTKIPPGRQTCSKSNRSQYISGIYLLPRKIKTLQMATYQGSIFSPGRS